MKFDQHFMIDEELIKEVVSFLNINKSETILEIGGGKGVLTEEILKKNKNLTVVEIDYELCLDLKSKYKNAKIINKNILDYRELNYDKIVGNLPYSILESLMRILVNSEFELAVFTVSKGFMKSDSLKLLMNIFFNIERLLIVNEESFDPMPKVKSEAIRITNKKINRKSILIREIYLQSNKKISNSIIDGFCKIYKLSKREAKAKLPSLKFLDKKSYTLNFKEWEELINILE